MKEEKKSSPVPKSGDEKENSRNQSTEVNRSKSNVKIVGLIIVLIIIGIIVIAFAGGF